MVFGEYNLDGQLPVYYSRKPNTANEEYVYTESGPLFTFGHRLSDTGFEYGDLSLSATELAPAGTITAEGTVRRRRCR